MEPNDLPVSPTPTSSLSSFHVWGSSWQEKLPALIVVLIIIGVVASLILSQGILKPPSPRGTKETQPLTDEQKIQNLKNLSGGSSKSTPQPSDQEKIQTLQKNSPTPQTAPQPSDAEKLNMLRQLNAQ